jgi:hypothetical protein
MNANLNGSAVRGATRLELSQNDAGAIRNGLGGTVSVERGSVWITQDGCVDDFVLGVGERFRIASNARVIATTLGRDAPAVIVLQPPERFSLSVRPAWFRHAAAALRT